MELQPSDTMRTLREMAEPNWRRLRETPQVTMIVEALAEVPGADGAQMGWSLLHQSFMLANLVDEIGPHVKARAFAGQLTQGFKAGGLNISVIGSELLSREDLRGDGDMPVPEAVAERRPGLVTDAEAALTTTLVPPEYAADLNDGTRDRGRLDGQGLFSVLMKSLPGLNPTQAGVAMLTTGGFLYSQASQAGVDEATRGLFRTRRKAAEGMSFAGMALTGAITVLCGDGCLNHA
jgi:hypothetical protein